MLISTITSNISFIQLSLMHRITEKICKERWQHWCTKISGVKVLPTLLISTITSNMSFIRLSLMLSGYPASSLLEALQIPFPVPERASERKSKDRTIDIFATEGINVVTLYVCVCFVYACLRWMFL